jgi:F-type H+-transporting ATPase subunit delta
LQAGKRNDVSDSYAKALVELAEEKNTLESVHADVDTLAGLVSANQKLAELLFNPVVESGKKKAVVAKISKEAGFQKYTTNFLNLLVEKDRMNLLNEICESFEEQYCTLTDTQVRRAGNAAQGQGAVRVCVAVTGSIETAVLGTLAAITAFIG